MAAAGGVVAIILVFVADYDKAFVAAAAGAVCWILSYRQQVRATLTSEERQREQDEESDEEVPE